MKRLGEVQDDTQAFTVAVTAPPPPEGQARIENLQAPTEVAPDTPFAVEYDCRNVGETDTLWGKIINRDTGETVPGSSWQETISSGGTKHIVTQFSGITADFHGRMECGHIED